MNLDPMVMLQLALGLVSELYVTVGTTEYKITRSTTFRGHEEVLNALRVYYHRILTTELSSSTTEGEN